MLVHFRKRLSLELVAQVNEEVVQEILGVKGASPASEAIAVSQSSDPQDTDDDEPPPPPHQGQLLVDATCAPADIHYPTDLSLLNEARVSP